MSLLIHVECLNKSVKGTVIDKSVASFMMSLACWKGLGSPELSKSATMLTAFDVISFQLHGILPSLKVRLGGKTVTIEVEVVDAPLDYNLLLGRNWMCSMQAVASSLFRVVCFPFNGKIVTIDQISFKNPCVTASSGASIPIVVHSQLETGSVGVGMYPTLMGSFIFPTHVLMIRSSFGEASSSVHSVSFCTIHVEDPWILPTPSPSSESIETDVLFPATMIAYQTNLGSVAEASPSSSWTEEEDPYVFLAWVV